MHGERRLLASAAFSAVTPFDFSIHPPPDPAFFAAFRLMPSRGFFFFFSRVLHRRYGGAAAAPERQKECGAAPREQKRQILPVHAKQKHETVEHDTPRQPSRPESADQRPFPPRPVTMPAMPPRRQQAAIIFPSGAKARTAERTRHNSHATGVRHVELPRTVPAAARPSAHEYEVASRDAPRQAAMLL